MFDIILLYILADVHQVYISFSDGEFDPGSGRTLAACLRNASRAGSNPSGERSRNT